MKNRMTKTTTIDEYIANFPPEIQALLQQIRRTIREAAPLAGEKIGYGIPTFTLNGNLVHFAGFKTHLSFFPTSSGVEHFKDELTAYQTSRGTIQFPLDQPIPFDLIRRITLFRVEENMRRAAAHRKK